MPEFLLELYISRETAATARRSAERARRAAGELTQEGTRVRLLRSIYVPEDEICFLLFDAASLDAVWQASRDARLDAQRIVEAVGGESGD